MNRRIVALALLASAAPALAQNSISERDRAQGAQANPQLVEQYGGAMTGKQADYVRRVGQRIAVQSGLSQNGSDFQVTLLNSNVNNAFAIPGGYVYVTRQLLALMNDEAELAFVMGHEVGHVAARHAASRNRTSTIGTIGSVLLGVLTGSQAVSQAAGQAAQLYTLRFSRGQETQADDLGISYLARAGYDPFGAPRVLEALEAQSMLDRQLTGQSDKSTPTWASTHPDPGARVSRAAQRAQAAGGSGRATNREAFLQAIDGMLYDDDPAQGVVEGRNFRHPQMRIGFTAPQGFAMQNGSDAVVIAGNGGQAQFRGGRYDGSLSRYVDAAFRSLSNNQMSAPQLRATRINGIEAAYGTIRANTRSGPVDATVFAYAPGGSTAYHFVLITPAGSGVGPLSPLVESFRTLSPQEAGSIRPRRVRVVTVAPGDSVASLSARMAYADARETRFRVLNALRAGDQVTPGRKVKLIVRD